MQKFLFKVFPLACLCIWVFVQLPVAFLHHHEEEVCSLVFDKNASGKSHFHTDEEEDCFCCSVIFAKSTHLPEEGFTLFVPVRKPKQLFSHSFSVQLFSGFSKGRSPPSSVVFA